MTELIDKIERAQVIDIKPGDVLVLTVDSNKPLSESERQYLKHSFDRLELGVKIIILQDCELGVLRKGDIEA